jgi:hypothetical protein
MASLLSPTIPTKMTWYQDCAQLILLIERRMVGSARRRSPELPCVRSNFNPSVDLTTSIGSTRGQIEHLVATAERLGPENACHRWPRQVARDHARRTTRRPTP